MIGKILVTGTAGFIGFHLVRKLFGFNVEIVGLDIINDYYDIDLKYNRLKESGIYKNEIEYNKLVRSVKYPGYSFIQLDLKDKENIISLFDDHKFDLVVNLAAQAGVRYSLTNPDAYIQSNIIGFFNILEACRKFPVKHLVYASSSSVYGSNTSLPFSTSDMVDHPISLYAASKKSNELMAHTYSHLFNIPTTGLRFFTVYGPWGRPDMALFIFTKAILAGKEIEIFNNGDMLRDFTYIDDIVEGIIRVMDHPPIDLIPKYKIYNIGNNNPVKLMDFIQAIEQELKVSAKKKYLPLQQGDVPATFADVNDLVNDLGYKPSTTVQFGIKRFVEWYLEYYK